MYVMFFFTVQTVKGIIESPRLGSGDIVLLNRLFPVSTVWKDGRNTHPQISLALADALYQDVVRYYANNDVSDEPYQTGNFSGSFAVTSTLVSVLDELIRFCEAELGLSAEGQSRRIVASKQQESNRQKDAALAEYRARTIGYFRTLGSLKPPMTAAIRSKIEQKRAEYARRIVEPRYPPPIAFEIVSTVRDSTYKVALVDELLAGKEVDLAVFAGSIFDQYGVRVDAPELYRACCVISVYLETPLVKGLSQASLIAARTDERV